MFKLITGGLTALCFVLAMPAMAQSSTGAYPSKAIKIIVPFPAVEPRTCLRGCWVKK